MAKPSSSPKSRLLCSTEIPPMTVPPLLLSVAIARNRVCHRVGNAAADVDRAAAAAQSLLRRGDTNHGHRQTHGRHTDHQARRARPINPESSRFFIRYNTLPATPQATRDYQRSAEPPGLNPDGNASGVPRATLSSDPAGVNRGSPRVVLSPRYLGQQVSLSVSNVRAVPAVSPRNVRSDAVASLWRPSPEGDVAVPALPIPALTPEQMSRVDRIMVDDFGVRCCN